MSDALAQLLLPAGKPSWELPELQALNRLPGRATLSSYASPEAAAAGGRSPWRATLNGRWEFRLADTPTDAIRTARLARGWSPFEVPGLWTMRGFDTPQYTNVQMPFTNEPPSVPDHNPTGIFRRTFAVPRGLEWAPRRARARRRRGNARRRAQCAAHRPLEGLADAGRVRRHGRRAPAWPERARGRADEVVGRELHRGSGSLVARRDLARGVPPLGPDRGRVRPRRSHRGLPRRRALGRSRRRRAARREAARRARSHRVCRACTGLRGRGQAPETVVGRATRAPSTRRLTPGRREHGDRTSASGASRSAIGNSWSTGGRSWCTASIATSTTIARAAPSRARRWSATCA